MPGSREILSSQSQPRPPERTRRLESRRILSSHFLSDLESKRNLFAQSNSDHTDLRGHSGNNPDLTSSPEKTDQTPESPSPRDLFSYFPDHFYPEQRKFSGYSSDQQTTSTGDSTGPEFPSYNLFPPFTHSESWNNGQTDSAPGQDQSKTSFWSHETVENTFEKLRLRPGKHIIRLIQETFNNPGLTRLLAISNNEPGENNIHRLIHSSFFDKPTQDSPGASSNTRRAEESNRNEQHEQTTNVNMSDSSNNLGRSNDSPSHTTLSQLRMTQRDNHLFRSSPSLYRDSQAYKSDIAERNSLGENVLSRFKSQAQGLTDNSGDTGIPTELRSHLDWFFSGSSQLETTRRFETQGLTRERMIAQVKEDFNQSFEAHKTKILDTSREFTFDEIGLIVVEGQKLWQDTRIILAESIKTFVQINGEIKSINEKVQNKIAVDKDVFLNAKNQIDLAERDLTSYTFPTSEDYNALRSNIGEVYNGAGKPYLLLSFDALQKELKNANFNKVGEDVRNMALSQTDQIDVLRIDALRFDQLFSGSSWLETIHRLEEQGLTRERMIAQVKEDFNQSFQAHKTKILDTSRKIPPDEIWNIIEEEQKLLLDSTLILTEPRITLKRIKDQIKEIPNWKVEDKIDEWKKKFPDAQKPEPESPYHDINVAKSEKVLLEVATAVLHKEREEVISAVQDLNSYTFPIAEDYNTLRTNIEEKYHGTAKVPLLQYINRLQKELEDADFNNFRENTLTQASSQINQIDALTEDKEAELSSAASKYEILKQQQYTQHPLLLQTDTLDADAKITVPPEGYLPGRGMVHMVLTIVHTHGFAVANAGQSKQFEPSFHRALGVHPHGGGVSVKQLETFFTGLETNFTGVGLQYQFRKIESKDLETASKDLKIALSTGKPIGAFLDTSQVDVISAENYYPDHAVTLARIQKNDTTGQDEVVVIDELRTAHDDPSRIVPYRIPVETFVKLGWKNGGVFLPKEASDALDRSKQSTQ